MLMYAGVKSIKEFVSSLKSISNHDPYCDRACHESGVPSHPDGWGMASIGNNEELYFRTPRPFYEYPISFPLRLAGETGIIHVRKRTTASSLIKNTHPMRIESGRDIVYIAHNGSVDRDVMNRLVPPGRRVGKMEMEHYSDTQLLSWFVGYRIGQEKRPGMKFWRSIFSDVVLKHEAAGKPYSMQLFILHLHNSNNRMKWSVIVVSAVSEKRMNEWYYYELFESEKEGGLAFFSSSIANNIGYGKPIKNMRIIRFNGSRLSRRLI